MKRSLHQKQSQPCHQHVFRLFSSHLTLHSHAVVVKFMRSDPRQRGNKGSKQGGKQPNTRADWPQHS